MVGSPFSPYYARARRRGPANPLDFVAMNVVLYGRDRSRWALTERAGPVREEQTLTIGPSMMRWDGDALVVDVDERTAPFDSRLRGRITIHPELVGEAGFSLDGSGAHRWWPIAPRARAEVVFEDPSLRFSGQGYLDANAGSEPLEKTLREWNWVRAPLSTGAFVSYEASSVDGLTTTLDLAFDRNGVHHVPHLSDSSLPRSNWGLRPKLRSHSQGNVANLRSFEDTPFYSRSKVAFDVLGERTVGVHESLSLPRFRSRWVQALLPMRMRRARL